MSVYNEGNTKYQLHKLFASRQYRVTAVCFIKGRQIQHVHKINDIGQDESDALLEGIEYLRPKIARDEALAKGVDPALPADPVIDRAIEQEVKARQYREQAEAEAIAIKEAAGQFLNEQNPLWGMF